MPRQSELERLDREADEMLKAANEPSDPPPDDPPNDPPAEPGEEPPASPPRDSDPLEGLTVENAQERIKNAQARMHTATREAAELRKENAALTARLQALEGDVSRLRSELEAAKQSPPPSDSATDANIQTLQELKDQYPSLVGPLLTTIEALQKKIEVLGGQVGEVKKTVETTQQAEISEAERRHYQAILEAHPDASALVKTDDFQGWLHRQPPMYSRALQEGSAKDVIDVLDKYKAAVGSARLDKARAAATPATPRARTQPTQPKPTFTRQQIAAMSDQEFLEKEAQIDAALREGRVTS